ncbi:AlpA family phage regulatory protein [Ralstonia pickettii]|uniref:helix-turn-helix transcriptional regulator n=1 Tax=Ralstonia pickettii TaxID=329 RepID=UPI0027150325|nr:AlpA family phage regulatory protein [Ralstonia pickettii]WKZ86487.1 AlpA family phage regulatory protein [Ralstonia pickettii]
MSKPNQPQSTEQAPADPIWRRRTVLAQVGVSNSTLHAWIKAGRFPPPLELGPRARGWRRSVVEAFLSSRTTTTDNH